MRAQTTGLELSTGPKIQRGMSSTHIDTQNQTLSVRELPFGKGIAPDVGRKKSKRLIFRVLFLGFNGFHKARHTPKGSGPPGGRRLIHSLTETAGHQKSCGLKLVVRPTQWYPPLWLS